MGMSRHGPCCSTVQGFQMKRTICTFTYSFDISYAETKYRNGEKEYRAEIVVQSINNLAINLTIPIS